MPYCREEDGAQAVLKVVGVGGAGLNVVNAMIDGGIEGVEFVAVNLAEPRLRKSRAERKVRIGTEQRFGTGGDPEVARHAVQETRQSFLELFQGADLVFIAAGMGSGTGTGASPAIAALAKEAGALVIAVVTKPFAFEGRQRMQKAEVGIRELELHADCVIVIPNDRLVGNSGKKTPLRDAFRPADDVLRQAVQGIADLVNQCGYINADFNDLRTVMSARGKSMIGMGTASGENRAAEAVGRAIESPLLEQGNISGANGVLVNITGSSRMSIDEFDHITRVVHDRADDDAVIIVGMVVDDAMGDAIKVTVIATGLSDGGGARGHLRLV